LKDAHTTSIICRYKKLAYRCQANNINYSNFFISFLNDIIKYEKQPKFNCE